MFSVPVTVSAQRMAVSIDHLRPQHRAIVEGWLKGKPGFRLATIADCLNKVGLAATRDYRGKSYHPYYAVGDFSRDRKEDFAVVLINTRKKEDRFAVAVFNGPTRKGNSPAYFADGWDLSDGGIFKSDVGVMVGPFESDNCVILHSTGKKYRAKDCLEG